MTGSATKESQASQTKVGEAMCYGSAWARRILGEASWSRDNNGCGINPDMPCFDDFSQAIKFFDIFGIELIAGYAESELDADSYLVLTHSNDFSNWTPEAPDGEGWVLVAIFDTEDGPAAWWLRQRPKTCEISQTEQSRKPVHQLAYPALPKGTDVIQFTSEAKVYTDEDMRAYVDADRLLRPDFTTVVSLAPMREKRVYIAGPMTGIEEHNYPAFNEAAKTLREAGWHVENPADHGVVEGAQWADYLHYDLGRLATCSALYLLPGWEKSRGACLEVLVAKELGMTIGYHLGAEVEPAQDIDDPLETPLPCDIKIGNITLRKGVALRLLVTRTKQLFEMATGESADAVANQSVEERQRKLLALQVAVGAVVNPSVQQASSACESEILMPALESLQNIEILRQRAISGEEFSPIEAFAHAHEPAQGNTAWRADLFDLLRHYAQRGNVHPGAINNAQFQQWWNKHMLWTHVDDAFEAWKDAVNTGICAAALSGLSVSSETNVQPTLQALIGLALAAHQVDVQSVDDDPQGTHVEVEKKSLEALGVALDALHELPNRPSSSSQCPADKASWALRNLLPSVHSASGRTLTLNR